MFGRTPTHHVESRSVAVRVVENGAVDVICEPDLSREKKEKVCSPGLTAVFPFAFVKPRKRRDCSVCLGE